MCITYIVDGSLYVNMTNRCSNRCEFCIRNNGDGAYGSDSLWLEREPTLEETLESVFSHDLTAFPELIFCGYGEPSYRLPDAVAVARAVKEKHPSIRIRINTNGHSDLIWNKDTAPMYEGAFDVVSISLNTPNPQRYQEICHSKFGEESHSALISFAERVKCYVPKVILSVVRETLTETEIEECQRIADKAGVTLRIRDYIGPEN
ncbi:MAG: radical SAM protein [Clostridia bacterium]|nr:radical SAM protein [Clostridia bacterium]